MTRPVAEILEKARREGWPTSFIDAMANHHLCSGITRDYVNECFSEPGALGSEIGDGGSPTGCGPARTGPHPPLYRKDAVSKPTPEELEQMRAGAEGLAQQGVDTRGIEAVIDLVTGVDPGPE